ncbi:MAG: hypothetical protein V3S89_07380 [Desulfobacterales bacterium]
MENISRDLRKQLKQPLSGSRGRRKRRWTLLFVEDRGKVISVGNVKGTMLAMIILLVGIIGTAAGFYFLHNRSEVRNSELQKALMNSEQRMMPLRNEKDVLMARLVVAEARIETLQSRNMSPKGADSKKVPSRQQPPDKMAREVPAQPESIRTVAIEKFKVFYDPGASNMETEFRLTNILGTEEPVSGFIFVVFRKTEAFDDGTMVQPAVNLISGKPADIRRGRYFLISRFNVIRFKTTMESSPEDFQYATVLVYARSGELMLSEEFPFQIEEVPTDVP